MTSYNFVSNKAEGDIVVGSPWQGGQGRDGAPSLSWPGCPELQGGGAEGTVAGRNKQTWGGETY